MLDPGISRYPAVGSPASPNFQFSGPPDPIPGIGHPSGEKPKVRAEKRHFFSQPPLLYFLATAFSGAIFSIRARGTLLASQPSDTAEAWSTEVGHSFGHSDDTPSYWAGNNRLYN